MLTFQLVAHNCVSCVARWQCLMKGGFNNFFYIICAILTSLFRVLTGGAFSRQELRQSATVLLAKKADDDSDEECSPQRVLAELHRSHDVIANRPRPVLKDEDWD